MKRVAEYGGLVTPQIFVTLSFLIFFSWISTSAQAQVVVYRINAGGRTTQAADVTYPDWSADEQLSTDPAPIQFARNGIPSIYVNEDVAGDQTAGKNQGQDLASLTNSAVNNDIMVTQRWDPLDPAENMIWSFPVSEERTYTVKLYFSEMFGEGLETRYFDIFIEGVQEEDDFNVLVETENGEKVGVEREYTVVMTDDMLEIEFVNQETPTGTMLPALINAIEIVDVNASNQAPTITAIPDQTHLEGQVVSLQVVAEDPDDALVDAASIISYTAENLPPGLSIDATGLIGGTIEFGSEDVYDTRIIVLDNGFPTAGAIENISWTVANGDPLVTAPIEDFTRFHGDPADVIDLSTVFSDPLGGELEFSLEGNNNQNVVMESLSGSMLTLTYSASLEGTADITVRATNDFEVFVEDEFSVTLLADHPQALVQVTPEGGLGASTFNGGSFIIENTSPGSAQINSVEIDLSTALYPDMVFDPTGNAGDNGFKCLTPDTGDVETGYIAPSDACVDPFSDPNEGGFYTIKINFDDFDPGEVFTFSVDADPTSIKGNPGVGDAGSVGGVEMMGGTVTVEFSNETVESNELFYIPESQGGSQATVRANPVTAPAIAIDGIIGSMVTVTDADQNIVVTGFPGETVTLFQSDGRLNVEGVPNGGFDLEPFEANEAIGGIWVYSGVIEAGGTVSIPVTLRRSDKADGAGDGGLNHFIAAFDGEFSSRVSNKLIIELQIPSTITLVDGWNMIGISYEISDLNYLSIFGDASPSQAPFAYENGGYIQLEDLSTGEGYWIDIDDPGNISLVGSDIPSVDIDVVDGWNMISGPSCIIDFVNVIDNGGIIVPSTLFSYDGAYQLATTVTPNQGYWIDVSANGTITLDCDAIVETETDRSITKPVLAPHAAFGVMRVSDDLGHKQDLYFGSELADKDIKRQYSMPPLNLNGFDARYTDDSRLVEGSEGMISVRGATFPITVQVAAAPISGSSDLMIEALAGNQVVESFQAYEGGEIVIANDKVTALRFGSDVMQTETLPETFALDGNYPNPFNPTTNLVFDLPEDATMQVTVFDLLGRQVMTLNAIEMAAGASRQMQIDASSLSSGTYLYKVQAKMASGTVVSTGRMTLLK